MTYSEIKITFTEDLTLGMILRILWDIPESDYHTFFSERWVNLRSNTNQVTIGVSTANIGERSAINFVNSFLLDYNVPVQYEVVRNINEVTIKSLNPYLVFDSGIVVLANEPVEGVVDFDITNFSGTPYLLEEVTFSEASETPCTKVKVNIETSELTTKILSPFVLEGNTENPFSFDWFRGQQINIVTESEDGQQLNLTLNAPDALNVVNFDFTIGSTPNGGTLSIEKINSNGLDVEYSLDNETWQEEEFFNGLAPDEYSLHVRDQLGCSFSINFSINEFGINAPYFNISKSNSIRYAERIDFDIPGNYKTDENTLSCEADTNPAYKEIQQFQTNDVITTQFKSNYPENTATIVKDNGDEVILPVLKKTNNIGNKEKRDALIYRYSQFKSGIYFTNGNTYDYDTNTVTRNYLLNGGLPNWAKAGNYILVDSNWYLIENIVYVEGKNADVLIISKTSLFVLATSVIVGSIFNIQNYEVYEFYVDMSEYNNEDFQVRINANSNVHTDVVHLSEQINVKEKQEGTLEIIYFNIDNNDVFYQTGIRHLMRLPITQVNGNFEDSSNTNKTDNSVVLLNATLYEGDEFVFEPVTKQLMRNIVIALSHKFVYLDGQGYVKSAEIEVEGPLDKSNLYVVTAKMLKTGTVYSDRSTGPIQLYNDEVVEIPGMIEWEGGFIQQ